MVHAFKEPLLLDSRWTPHPRQNDVELPRISSIIIDLLLVPPDEKRLSHCSSCEWRNDGVSSTSCFNNHFWNISKLFKNLLLFFWGVAVLPPPMHLLEQAMPLRRSTPSVVNLSHHVFVQKTHWSYRRCSCVFAHFFGCGCWSYVTAGANFVRFNYRQPIICSPTLQGRIKSNLKKIPLKNRRCHFDKRDALVWKLV